MVIVLQGSTLLELARAKCLEDGAAIWSLWAGYLDQPSGERTARLLEKNGVSLVHLHASGHARVKDLGTVAEAMAPARVVPIHTSAPELYDSILANVEQRRDGEWWNV